MDKQTLRRSGRIRRMNLSTTEVTKKSKLVADNLIKAVDWGKVKTVHTYINNESMNEPQTTILLPRLWRHTKLSTYAPRLIGRSMEIVTITKDTHYTPNMRGIPEPDSDDVVELKAIDIILVPLVVFDKNLNRLGYGGGYYDRFLKEYPLAYKIGIGFEEDKVEVIPTEEHDVKLNLVITDKNIYEKSKN